MPVGLWVKAVLIYISPFKLSFRAAVYGLQTPHVTACAEASEKCKKYLKLFLTKKTKQNKILKSKTQTKEYWKAVTMNNITFKIKYF